MLARTSNSLGARAALREATREVHEGLHVSPEFLAIAEGRLALPEYGELLHRLATIYFALAPGLGIDPQRMERLARDLADLGVPVPVPVRWRAPASGAQKLGWQYVVEGSIFGGQVIYRQLDYLFGEAEAGRRFFSSAPDGPVRWRALCAAIERTGAEEQGLEEMSIGSCEAFAYFEERLTAEPVHG